MFTGICKICFIVISVNTSNNLGHGFKGALSRYLANYQKVEGNLALIEFQK